MKRLPDSRARARPSPRAALTFPRGRPTPGSSSRPSSIPPTASSRCRTTCVFLNTTTGQVGTTLNAPTTGGTAAQNEFNANYLNLLDGFPMESTASVLFSQPIDLDLGEALPGRVGREPRRPRHHQPTSPQVVPTLNITTSPAAGGAQSLNIIPTSGFWTKGHHYGILIVGGPNGVKGASSSQTVTGSPTWALVSGSAPVLACDAQGQNCRPGSSVIPATGTDPAQQYQSQLAAAQQLNLLQKNYAPVHRRRDGCHPRPHRGQHRHRVDLHHHQPAGGHLQSGSGEPRHSLPQRHPEPHRAPGRPPRAAGRRRDHRALYRPQHARRLLHHGADRQRER